MAGSEVEVPFQSVVPVLSHKEQDPMLKGTDLTLKNVPLEKREDIDIGSTLRERGTGYFDFEKMAPRFAHSPR